MNGNRKKSNARRAQDEFDAAVALADAAQTKADKARAEADKAGAEADSAMKRR